MRSLFRLTQIRDLVLTIRSDRRSLIFAIVLTIFLSTVSVSAQDVINLPCSPVNTVRVTYYPISGTVHTNALDSRTDPGDSTHEVKLRGSLHYRLEPGETLKNRPVLIFNHGHEQKRGEACTIVRYFTEKGWIVFAPLRRGHFIDMNGDDDGNDPVDIRSTGVHVDTFVDKCMRTQSVAEDSGFLTHLYRQSGFCRPQAAQYPYYDSAVELFYLNQQNIDVRDQIAFVKSLLAITPEPRFRTRKLADPDQIAILGHSYGGALTVFSNTFDYGQSVAIDISGAELSWDNEDEPYWMWDLKTAMFEQKRPVYLLQPNNAKYLTPTKDLFSIAVNQMYRSQASIFPPAPCDDEDASGNPLYPPNCLNTDVTPANKQVHSSFIGKEAQVRNWGPSVIEFAQRNKR